MRFHKHTQADDSPAAPASRHTLPLVTSEQRKAALARSVQVRRQRAEVLAAVRAGTVSLAAALAHPHVQRARIGQVVRSVKGVGPVKAAALLAAAGIDPERRVSQVGERQREKLLARLDGTGQETGTTRLTCWPGGPQTTTRKVTPMTETTTPVDAVVIRNQPNNCLTRFPCSLCGGGTEKQAYLFELPDGGIVCDECAEHPEQIAERAREEAAHLRIHAERLEAIADRAYITEVVPLDDEIRDAQLGMYSEDYWPNWMRTRIGLPALTDADHNAISDRNMTAARAYHSQREAAVDKPGFDSPF